LTSTFSPAVATSLSNDFEIVSVRTNVPEISATPRTTAISVKMVRALRSRRPR
jgi:hypothetical protein